jgi:hypothetical protein
MGVVSQSELPPGQCSGIGWGCSLTGWDAVGIGLIFIGVPLLFLLLVGHLIIGAAQVIRSRRRAASRNWRLRMYRHRQQLAALPRSQRVQKVQELCDLAVA